MDSTLWNLRNQTKTHTIFYKIFIPILLSMLTLCSPSYSIAATQNVTFELTKSVDNATPELNQQFTYTLFYRCASLTETHCTDMVVTDQLSNDLQFISAAAGAHPATITESGNLVTFTFDQPVPAGSTGQLALTVRIPLSAGVNSGDVIPNTATIDASNASGPLESNPVNVTATVGNIAANYHKNGGSETAALDTDYEYSMVIDPQSNLVTNAIIVDDLPPGTLYISCSGGDSCNYDSTNHRVTWIDASSTSRKTYQVIIQFPSGTFNNGDVVNNTATFTFDDGSTPVDDTSTYPATIASAVPILDVQKWGYVASDIWGSRDVKIGEEAGYPYKIKNAGTAVVTNAVITDIFPAEFDFTRIQTPHFNTPYPTGLTFYYELNSNGSWVQFPGSAYNNGTGANPANDEVVTLAELGISAPDRVTAIQIEVATIDIGVGSNGGAHGIIYGTLNNNAIGNATVENCISGSADGGTSDNHCTNVNVDAQNVAALDSYKWVKGLDELGFVNPINSDVCEDNGQGYTRYPCVAQTVQGGIADYQLVLENPGTINMTDIILIDILPHIGDTGVLVTGPRDTEWRPNLAGPVTAPAGVTVFYSTSNNPCRGEVGGPTTGCDAPNWSTTPPTDITTVGSLKFDFGTIEIAPGEQFILTWPMRVPNGTPTDEIAWNSFAYVTSRADNGVELLPSEPPKVGIITKPDQPNTYGDYIWLDTNRDGIQDSGETGLNGVQIDLYQDVNGTPTDFTDDLHVGFTVSGNDGNGNPGYYLFPNLPDGHYYAVATPPSVYAISPLDASGDGGANDATDAEDDSDFDPTTLRTPITELGPRDVALVEEIDKSWDLGVYLLGPSILLEKTVYTGHDSGASCPSVELVQASTGSDVTYCFVITNNGETDLDDITFADATLGITGADVVSPIITNTVLAQGSSMTVYYEAASLGTITNTATVDGRPIDGNGNPILDPETGQPLDRPTDDDTAATEEGVIIGDLVWIEDDNDGDATTGVIIPVVGSLVTATTSDGTLYTGTTDANGLYTITVPSNTTYTVTVATPSGTLPAGTLITSDNDPNSNDNLSHDGSGTVVAVGTEDNLTIDFGFYEIPEKVALGNLVWIDDGAGGGTANNGIIDGTEAGLDGVTVELYAGTIITGTPLSTTVTSGGGFYLFDQLSTGDYVVHIPASQFASGAPLEVYQSSTGAGADDSNDDDVDENGLDTPDNGGINSAVINLAGDAEPTNEAGQGTYPGALDDDNVNMTVDFGFYQPLGSIGDTIWGDMDQDGDSVLDGSDVPLAGVVVELEMPDGTNITTTTNVNGTYLFPDLPYGTYTVTVDTTTLPTGYVTTPSYDPDGGSDSTSVATLDSTTPTNLEQDFSYPPIPDVLIGDRAWIEDDNDGLATTGVITPVVGSVVTAVASDGTVYTDTTDTMGYYTITVPANMTYTVTVATPAGTTPTPLTGGNLITDTTSGDDMSHDGSGTTVVVETEDNLTVDFGFYELPPSVPSLALSKTLNRPEPVEVGQPVSFTIRITNTGNVTITMLPLMDTYDTTYLTYDSLNGSIPATDDNADDGQLNWSDLTVTEGDLGPGGVIEVVTNFTAQADTAALAAQAPCVNSGESCNVASVDGAIAGSEPVPSVEDSDDVEIEEPITGKSTLGDFVWFDTNSDGIKDPSETGINGVIINLYDSTGLVTTTVTMSDIGGIGDDTGTTNGDGFYDFEVLPSTVYTVEIDPSNFAPGGALEGFTYTGNNATMPYSGDETRVVGMPAVQHDENNVDFGYVAPTLFELSKTLNTPSPARVGERISFTIRITNTGATVMTHVPLTDTYNNAYMSYTAISTPEPDSPNVGELIWNDLTSSGASGFGMDLNPGEAFAVTVEFITKIDTTGLPNDSAINLATSRGITDTAEVQAFSPTSVLFVQRSADYENKQVVLHWETADETKILYFHLYRRLTGSEEVVQLNAEPLLAKESARSLGASYEYIDETAVAGMNYEYSVVIHNSDGTEERQDLGSVRTSALQGWWLYLPLIQQ